MKKKFDDGIGLVIAYLVLSIVIGVLAAILGFIVLGTMTIWGGIVYG